MTPICAPDIAQGVAIRLSQYAGCEARAIGESGFQALAGGPIGTSILSGLVTIFIALIGYRFILGTAPSIRDGVGWAARLGLVLALVTSWPAFQTLIFRVATDGPAEVANVVLPASGLGFVDLDTRVQQAYDTMRLGTFDVPASSNSAPAAMPENQASATQPFKFETPLPNTASLLVISTLGVLAALQIAIGFLLAIAPLPLMSLLFDGTSGLFGGWLRALVGATMMTVAATVMTSVDLVMVESELGHLEIYRTAMTTQMIDPQALTTIVALFTLAMIITLILASRVASVLAVPSRLFSGNPERQSFPETAAPFSQLARSNPEYGLAQANVHEQSRVTSVTEALIKAGQREQILLAEGQAPDMISRHSRNARASERSEHNLASAHVLTTNRRRVARRTHSAVRRDRSV